MARWRIKPDVEGTKARGSATPRSMNSVVARIAGPTMSAVIPRPASSARAGRMTELVGGGDVGGPDIDDASAVDIERFRIRARQLDEKVRDLRCHELRIARTLLRGRERGVASPRV